MKSSKKIYVVWCKKGMGEKVALKSWDMICESIKAIENTNDISFVTTFNDEIESTSDNVNRLLWIFGKSLMNMSECDCVYVVDGYRNSRLCMTEYIIATLYGCETKELKQENV